MAGTIIRTVTTVISINPARRWAALASLALLACSALVARAAEPITNSLGMKLVQIPAGEFVIGSPEKEPGRQEREAPRKVRLTHSFYLDAHEVTQAQYAAVMKTNPSRFGREARRDSAASAKEFEQHPVECVAWHQAVDFCERLSRLEVEVKAGRRYRLPTEAEWEYACRAGSTTTWSFGDDRRELEKYAWHRGRESPHTSHQVGEKLPNAWGLYDMHGNVWEWCADWYAEDRPGADTAGAALVDPLGPKDGKLRVIRGGAYLSVAAHTRSATRFHDPPDVTDDDLGFRVVMELVTGAKPDSACQK